MEDVLLLTAGMLAEEERVAAQVRRPVQVVRRRRVPGRLARSSRPCSTCGSADVTRSAWSATRPRRSTPSPAPTPTISATSARSSPAPPRSSSTATTARRPRWSRPPTPCWPVRRPRPCDCAPSDRPAHRCTTSRRPTRSPRRTPWPRPSAGSSPTVCRPPRSPSCSGSTPSPRRSRRRSPSRGIPYVVRGAARFFERGEVRQAVTLIRGAAHTDGGETPVAELVRATLGGMGWTPEAPAARGQTRDRWESLQALVAMAEESPDLTAGGVRDRPRPSRVRAARSRRRGRDPVDAPRRQGPGVGRRLPGRDARRRHAAVPRDDARGDRGGAPAPLRRHDPRAPPPHGLLGLRPYAGWSRQPAAVPVPRPAAPRRRACQASPPQGPTGSPLP